MHVVIPVWFRAPLGGLQSNVAQTVNLLLRRGHRATVICPDGPFAGIIEELGARAIRTDFSNSSEILDLLNNDGVDLVHTHPGQARVLSLKITESLGVPTIITFHGSWVDSIQTYWAKTDKVIAVSNAVKQRVLSFAPDARDRTIVIPNATSIVAQDAESQKDADMPDIVVGSRFDADKVKLIEFIMDVWTQQAERGITLRWQLAGAGTEMEQLLEKGTDLNNSLNFEAVSFLGWLPEQELQNLNSRARFACAPGRSAIDALGRGLPTVAVGSAGCFGLVLPENYDQAADCNFGGYGLQEQADAEAVLNDIMRLAGNADEYIRVSDLLREKVRAHHNQAYWDDQLMEVYQRAVGHGESQ